MQPTTPIKYLNGQAEALDFTPLSITERHKFVNLLCAGETPQLVSLCARRNLAWVDSLDFDCYLELAKKFIRENFPFAMRIAQTDPIAGLKVGPMLMQMASLLYSLPSDNSAATPSTAGTNGAGLPSAPSPTASAEEITGAAAATPPAA